LQRPHLNMLCVSVDILTMQTAISK
jgi:hypothetical protein